MAGVEIASAYVTLLPSMKGFGKNISKEMDSLGAAHGKGYGNSFASSVKKWGGRALKGAALSIGTLVGGAVVAGINRSMKIEDAQAKLTGLGHSAETVTKIMENALSSVKGTAFGLDEAATNAATAVAAGVKPGKELARYLSLVGDAATIGGTSLGEMGSIFGKVQTNQRAYTQELNQLADRGIPIYQWLQKELGVSAESLRKMVADGKIDSETYFRVIEENIGGAALSAGDTTRGALKNLFAAYSRFGQQIVEGIFPYIKGGVQALTAILDSATEKVGPFMDRLYEGLFSVYTLLKDGDFTEAFGNAFGVEEDSFIVDFLLTVRDGVLRVKDGVVGLFEVLGGGTTGRLANALGVDQGSIIIDFLRVLPDHLDRFKNAVEGTFTILAGGTTGQLANALGVDQGHFLIGFLQGIHDKGELAVETFKNAKAEIMPTLESLGTWISDNRELLSGILTGIGVFIGLVKGVPAVVGVMAGAIGLLARVMTPLLGLFGLLAAHPVILALSLLAGAFVYLWQTNDTFREKITEGFETIKRVTTDVWTNTVQPAIEDVWNWINDTLIPGLTSFWNDHFEPIFSDIGDIVVTAWNDQIWPALQEFWTTIQEDVIPTLTNLWENVVKPVFTFIGETVMMAWDKFIGPALREIVAFIVEVLVPNILWLWNKVVLPAFTAIGRIVESVWVNVLQPNLERLRFILFDILAPVILWLWEHVVRPAFEGIAAVIKWAWEKVIGPVLGWLVDFIVDTLLPWMGRLGDRADEIWNDIGNVIEWAWENVISPVFDALSAGVEWVVNAFDSAVSGIKKAWDWLKMIVAKPIVAVLNFINTGIIDGINKVLGWVKIDGIDHINIPNELRWAASGFYTKTRHAQGKNTALADGGILPGYSPGFDDLHFLGPNGSLSLAGGEAIMRPEWTKAVGADWINSMNAAARSGGVNGVRSALGFADGGIFGGQKTGGNVFEALGDIGGGIVDFIRDPLGTLKRLMSKGLSALTDNPLYDFISGFIGKTVGGIKDWLWDKVFGSTEGYGGENKVGMPWNAIWALVARMVPGATMTSGYRAMRTTASGAYSYHNRGRAVDFVSGNMGAAWETLRRTGMPWSELYYTPKGFIRNGILVDPKHVAAVTKANHYSHVHVAMNKGGIFSGEYDSGGYIPPGVSLVTNNTGKPEPVLTGDQWDRLEAGSGNTINLYGVPLDVAGDVAATINYEIRRNRRGKYARR